MCNYYRGLSDVNSKEIIKRVIEFDHPERIGFDFILPNPTDITWITVTRLKNHMYDDRLEWGCYEEELKKIPGFNGEVQRDVYGNLYGRLNQKTKGECLKGALQDGWEKLKDYEMPLYDETYESSLPDILRNNEEKFLLGALPVSPFSTMRDLRRIDNLLMDIALEEDMVMQLLEKVEKLAVHIICRVARFGFDGVVICDDWGTQQALFINPVQWRRIFKPVYTRLADEAHKGGMKASSRVILSAILNPLVRLSKVIGLTPVANIRFIIVFVCFFKTSYHFLTKPVLLIESANKSNWKLKSSLAKWSYSSIKT
jgi:hypothetical protein